MPKVACSLSFQFLSHLPNHYLKRSVSNSKKQEQYLIKNFATIIRQLAKLHNIKVVSKIIYNNSNYEISYYIYK